MTDETYEFTPPLSVADLLAAAERPEWAEVATWMTARMLRAVDRGGAVQRAWYRALRNLGFAELDHQHEPGATYPITYVRCRLTPAGLLAARNTGAML